MNAAGKLKSALVGTAWLILCVVLPLIGFYYVVEYIASYRTPDFGVAYYGAAQAVLDGESMYKTGDFVQVDGLILDYVYPPLTAIAVIPFTVVSADVAEVIFATLLLVAFVATLAVLGVRDWRCYGLAFIWPPVLESIETANITILLALGTALVWRYRDRPAASGASLGVGLAAKTLLWPLAIWLAATRRVSAAVWACAVAVAVLLLTWGAIGFDGLTAYPGLVRRLSDVMDERSYSLYALALDLGLPSAFARILWLGLAVALLAATVIVARRGDDRRAFVLAIAATLACSPIVWIHYLMLLVVAIAVAEPRLGLVWFLGIPMQVFVTTGVDNGSTFQTAAMLATAALAVVLALRGQRRSAWDWPGLRGRPLHDRDVVVAVEGPSSRLGQEVVDARRFRP